MAFGLELSGTGYKNVGVNAADRQGTIGPVVAPMAAVAGLGTQAGESH